jgi:prepilin signal peptidase PulO-like enzyme (type II secretory pathway)
VTKFRHLPAVGRLIIITVATGVFAVAAVACATSYNAIYRLVEMLGLYGAGITKAFPLMLDVAFIVAELAAILGGIMRAVTRSDEVTKGWPNTTMLLCGVATIAFNVAHAFLLGGRNDPLTVWRCVVASLPPVLMMVSFQVLIAIVKWVMLHLGRPLNSAAALSPTGMPGYGPGLPGPWTAYGQMPNAGAWPMSSGNPQNGQGNGGGELPETYKRAAIEGYLSQLSPDQLGRATGAEVRKALAAEQGIEVSERYARRIVDSYRDARTPISPRKRKR